jgi:hypothetical protein
VLKQGLLSYALVHNGIEEARADFRPADKKIMMAEWLEYGEARVPKLYEELRTGKLQSEVKELIRESFDEISRQRPSLFDFSKKRREILLVELK